MVHCTGVLRIASKLVRSLLHSSTCLHVLFLKIVYIPGSRRLGPQPVGLGFLRRTACVRKAWRRGTVTVRGKFGLLQVTRVLAALSCTCILAPLALFHALLNPGQHGEAANLRLLAVVGVTWIFFWTGVGDVRCLQHIGPKLGQSSRASTSG